MRRAVQRFVSAKRLQPVAFMGEGLDGPWLLRDGRRVEEREAVACEARVVCLSVRVSQWFSIVFNCFQVVSSGFKWFQGLGIQLLRSCGREKSLFRLSCRLSE